MNRGGVRVKRVYQEAVHESVGSSSRGALIQVLDIFFLVSTSGLHLPYA